MHPTGAGMSPTKMVTDALVMVLIMTPRARLLYVASTALLPGTYRGEGATDVRERPTGRAEPSHSCLSPALGE